MKYTYQEFCIIRQINELGVQPNMYINVLSNTIATMKQRSEVNQHGIDMLQSLINKLKGK